MTKKDKQFSIFFKDGDKTKCLKATEYSFSTFDIRSVNTPNDVVSIPVMFIVDDVTDTADIICMDDFKRIKYHWGFKEEVEKFKEKVNALKKQIVEEPEEPPYVSPDIHLDERLYG